MLNDRRALPAGAQGRGTRQIPGHGRAQAGFQANLGRKAAFRYDTVLNGRLWECMADRTRGFTWKVPLRRWHRSASCGTYRRDLLNGRHENIESLLPVIHEFPLIADRITMRFRQIRLPSLVIEQ